MKLDYYAKVVVPGWQPFRNKDGGYNLHVNDVGVLPSRLNLHSDRVTMVVRGLVNIPRYSYVWWLWT